MSNYTRKFVLGTGAVLVMFITFICLGYWQVERLKWKNNLIQKVSDVSIKTFVPVEELIVNYANIENIELHKVLLRGTFHHDLSITLIPRTWNGINGGHLYTPMTLTASDHTILVNRGWVPSAQENISIDKLIGEIEVLGYLQEPALPGWLTPDNVSEHKAWYYIDIEAIQEELKKQHPFVGQKMLPFYAIAYSKSEEDIYPKSLEPMSLLRNNHLGYAITWFSLAIALVAMFVVYVSRDKR